ncbi:sodium:calcium exchanger [Amycolatopsis sp. cg5]|uniref:sodium:calcium exchanger n=1 Tax=Amycolatopsis sp. cg5 TaxID=3238802 RepID=UPI003524CE6B
MTVTAPAGCTANGTVRYRVVDGRAHGVYPELSADRGSDYAADPEMPLTGTLSWKDSLETKYVDIAVNQDFLPEQNEAFWLELLEPAGLVVAEDRVPNAINDDDAKPPPDAVVVAPDGKICWRYCEVPVYGFGFAAAAAANAGQTMTVHYRTVEQGGSTGSIGYVPVRDAVLTLTAGQPLAKAKVQLLPVDREVKFEIEFFSPQGGKLAMNRTVVTVKPWR